MSRLFFLYLVWNAVCGDNTKLSAIRKAPLDRTHPTNITSQWRDEWKSALVVNSSLVDNPSKQDSTYPDATGHSWITSGPTKATAHPVERSGALQQLTCNLVANAKRFHILSTAAHSPSWRGLQWLHSADDVATEWLKTYSSYEVNALDNNNNDNQGRFFTGLMLSLSYKWQCSSTEGNANMLKHYVVRK